MPIQTINPFNNEIAKSFEEMSSTDVKVAISIADETFQSWRKTTFSERAALLHSVAQLMRAQKDHLSKLITLEMGKLLAQSYGEIELSADIIDYYATNGESFLEDQVLEPNDGAAYVRSTPIGVLLGVEPWNFPFYQVARFAAPNIMAGNVVLVKHASNVPQCALSIQRLFEEAGAPQGLYTNLFLSGSRVDEAITDSRIKGVSFTGSETAGSSLAASAGKSLKKSVLELGGSDAFIVLEDADVDQAVKWAVIGRMNNTGQCCVAAKRIIVVESIAE
jgi:succinate-semialdehyde dehydrogenase/glutarate-semialdehyde dehydrogenase